MADTNDATTSSPPLHCRLATQGAGIGWDLNITSWSVCSTRQAVSGAALHSTVRTNGQVSFPLTRIVSGGICGTSTAPVVMAGSADNKYYYVTLQTKVFEVIHNSKLILCGRNNYSSPMTRR
jgi:hypothetical protein